MSSGTPLTASNDFALLTPKRSSRLAFRAGVGAAATALLLGLSGAPAFAETDTLNVTVNVSEALVFSVTQSSITLDIAPGVPDSATVSMNVLTNNPTGYDVTVAGQTANFDAALPANDGVLPIGALTVSGGDLISPQSVPGPDPASALEIASQGTASEDGGDVINTTFSMAGQNVPADTYTATLDFVATTTV